MMYEINLIRDRVALYRRRIVRRVFVYSAVLVLLISIMVGVSVYLGNFYKIRTDKKQVDMLNARISDLGLSPSLIRNYKAELDEFAGKLSLIAKTRPKRVLWAPKLAAISALLPSDMWLHKISVGGDDNDKSQILLLKGYALPKAGRELIRLRNFISALEKSSLFMEGLSKIELVFVRQEKKGGQDVTAFQLSCPFSLQ
jgi:Tfp pilus assembly protein PilN